MKEMANKAFLVTILAGTVIHRLIRNRVRIHFVYKGEEPDFSQEMLFDCPMCGMPAEISSIMTRMGEGSNYINFYILNCLGDHDTAAVTEEWYKENVLTRR